MNAKIAAFLYHEVVDRPLKSGFEGKSAQPYKHSKKEFCDFLNIIQASPVKPVMVDQVDFLSGNEYILLTFDDGGVSNLYIADEMEKRGWFGHFFIPTAFIGSRNFMSQKEIRELHLRGHAIGSHSHSHPSPFYLLSDRELNKEWRTSLDILSDIVNDKIKIGSVPGGEMDRRALRSARDSGLDYLFTSQPTLNPWLVDEMIALGRICPKSGTSIKKIERFAKFKSYRYEMAKWTVKRFLSKTLVQMGNKTPSAPSVD